MTVEIFYADEFKRNVRKLLKKYPQLSKDVDGFIRQLQAGKISGDLIQNVGFNVYKMRVKNSDNKKGKSTGYRVIYYVKHQNSIVLITIYSKSEQSDISAKEICSIIEKWHEEQ